MVVNVGQFLMDEKKKKSSDSGNVVLQKENENYHHPCPERMQLRNYNYNDHHPLLYLLSLYLHTIKKNINF